MANKQRGDSMLKCSGVGARRNLWREAIRGFWQYIVLVMTLLVTVDVHYLDCGQVNDVGMRLIRNCDETTFESVIFAATRWHTAVSVAYRTAEIATLPVKRCSNYSSIISVQVKTS